jgi:hypothetical protein
MKSSKDTIGNRTRDLPAVSSVGYSPFLGNKFEKNFVLLLFLLLSHAALKCSVQQCT